MSMRWQIWGGIFVMVCAMMLYSVAVQKEMMAIPQAMAQEETLSQGDMAMAPGGQLVAPSFDMSTRAPESLTVPVQEEIVAQQPVSEPESPVENQARVQAEGVESEVPAETPTEPGLKPEMGEQREAPLDEGGSIPQNTNDFACTTIESSEDFIPSVKNPSLLYFYSRHCGACAMTKEPMNEFIKAHADEVACYAVDVDKPGVRTLAEVFKISGVPSMVVVHKFVGSMSKEVIEQALAASLGIRPAKNEAQNGAQPAEMMSAEEFAKKAASGEIVVHEPSARSESSVDAQLPQKGAVGKKITFDEAVQEQALRVTPEDLVEEEAVTFVPGLEVSRGSVK